jgi:RHS repeat-associated protein
MGTRGCRSRCAYGSIIFLAVILLVIVVYSIAPLHRRTATVQPSSPARTTTGDTDAAPPASALDPRILPAGRTALSASGLANDETVRRLWPDATVLEEIHRPADATGLTEDVFLLRTDAKHPLVRVSLSRDRNGHVAHIDEAAAGHALVQFNEGVSSAEVAELARRLDMVATRRFADPNVYAFAWTNAGMEALPNALGTLRRLPEVACAEPDVVTRSLGAPNDTEYTNQWALRNATDSARDIAADAIWELPALAGDALVAIVDTGIDYRHEDLAANMSVNAGEQGLDSQGRDKANNGIDDEEDGFADNVHGWDFYNDDCDPMDDNGHGTHCAGVAGAVTDNALGMAGLCRNAKLLAIKTQGPDGIGFFSDAIDGIRFAQQMGAQTILAPWGAAKDSALLRAAVADAGASGACLVTSAGNDGADIDTIPCYPASYADDRILAVGASDREDRPAFFGDAPLGTRAREGASNYGLRSVDLFAPGVDILGTIPGNRYATMSGSSAAAALAAGAYAALKAAYPSETAAQIKDRLLNGADRVAALREKSVSGGRLNIAGALRNAQAETPSDLLAIDEWDGSVLLQWTDRSAVEVSFEIERWDNGNGWSVLALTDADVAAFRDQVEPGSVNAYRVFAVGVDGARSEPSNIAWIPRDTDGDGLADVEERRLGLDPFSSDTDADGMPDGWELQHGLNPLANDALADADGDGYANELEFHAQTDPQNALSYREEALYDSLGAGWFDLQANPFPAGGGDIHSAGFFKFLSKALDIITKPFQIIGAAVDRVTQSVAQTVSGWAYLAEPDFVPYDVVSLLQKPPAFTVKGKGEAEIHEEIAELARGLDNDVERIYRYVHEHIEYEPYYGCKKGALLTLWDRRGNDFDQAALTMALLQAARRNTTNAAFRKVEYIWGTMDIPVGAKETGPGLANWIGVEGLENVRQALACGGIPFEAAGPNALRVNRVWLRVTADTNAKDYDPAFKSYAYSRGFTNWAEAMGYRREDVLAAATNGGAMGSDYIQRLNETGLYARLTGYATNLMHYLDAEHAGEDARTILGGREIVAMSDSALDRFPSAAAFAWERMPDLYMAELRVEMGELKASFRLPEMATRKLTLTYSADKKAALWVDESRLMECSVTTSNLTIAINEPYPANANRYGDQTKQSALNANSTVAILCDLGGGLRARGLHKRYQVLDEYYQLGHNTDSRQMISEVLYIVGLSWMRQANLAAALRDRLEGTRTLVHHRFGLAAQDTEAHVDFHQCTSTLGAREGRRGASKFAAGLLGSALEHGVFDQALGTNRAGMSTVKALSLANRRGDKFFNAHAGNFEQIKGQLSGYDAATLEKIRKAVVDDGWKAILTQTREVRLGDWKGSGYIRYQDAEGQWGVGMIINDDLYGGSVVGQLLAQTVVAVACVGVNSTVGVGWTVDGNGVKWNGVANPTSAEPVDLGSGAYLLECADLDLGGKEPWGLHFRRLYSSAWARRKESMGYGWAHNYHINVKTQSDGEAGWGRRTAADAVGAIVGTVACVDLMDGTTDLKEWMTGVLAAQWTMDQLTENIVDAQLGLKLLEYVRLPNGSYHAPPGVTTELVKEQGVFRLHEKDGRRLDFDAQQRIVNLWDADSNRMSFAYANGRLDKVTDGVGRTLTFRYTNADDTNLLTRLEDSTGRAVDFAYDYRGDLTGYTDPEGGVWRYEYDGKHRIVALRDPENRVTIRNDYADDKVVRQIAADGHGWNYYYTGYCNAEENPLGDRKKYYFDEDARPIGFEDESGRRWSVAYNGWNRPQTETDARDFATHYRYDARGNCTNITDALGQSQAFVYDEDGRLIETRDPAGASRQYAYDAEHHPIRVTDALGQRREYAYYPNGLLQRETWADGARAIEYTYNAYGQVATLTRTDGGTTRHEYDAQGNLLKTVDPLGHARTFQYNRKRQPIGETDELGNTVRRAYTPFGKIRREVDARGRAVEYTYTPAYRVETVRKRDGGVWRYRYDSRQNEIAVVDPLGHAVSNEYDRCGRKITTIDALGGRTAFEYDANGNLLRRIDPNGHATDAAYDALNRPVLSSNALGFVVRKAYDAAGRMAMAVDALGRETVMTYDALGRLTNTAYADGSATAFGYDAAGNRVWERDANGAVTTYGYDGMNRRVASTNAYGFATREVYDERGDLTETVDALGNVVRSIYDAARRLVETQFPDGARERFGYDAGGNLTTSVDRNGGKTFREYDAMNRLVKTIDALGHIDRFEYDLAGNLVKTIDKRGHVTRHRYDAAGRPIETQFPDGSSNVYAYDAAGNRVATADGLGMRATYGFDALNRMVARTNAAGGVAFTAYDAVGNILATADELGRLTRYAYDARDRVTAKTFPDETVERYAYDPAGNRTSVADALGRRATFGYDRLNRLVAATNALGGVVRSGYDRVGNRVWRQDELGRVVSNEYDAVRRLVAAFNADGSCKRYAYDANGNLTAETDENGRITTWSYDADNRPVSKRDAAGGVAHYAYDAQGNLCAERDALGFQTRWSYDPMQRMTSAVYADETELQRVYDAGGNLLSEKNRRGFVTTFGYDELNRLAAITNAEGGVTCYAYDAAGNRVWERNAKDGVTAYRYDARDRLSVVTYPNGRQESYAYDVLGNRLQALDCETNAVTYGYDELNRLVAVTNALGFVERTLYDAAGQVVARIDAEGRTTRYDYDSLGRVTNTVYANADRETYEYDRVGNRTAVIDPVGNTTRFTYDAMNRVSATSDPQGDTTSNAYDAVGNPIARIDAGGQRTVYEYDANRQVAAIRYPSGRAERYAYDPEGRLLTFIDGQGARTEYLYDALGRPIETKDALGNREVLAYDGVGNLTNRADAEGRQTVYAYDSVNNRTRVEYPGGATIVNTYDGCRRLLSAQDALGTVQYEYDALGRMAAARDPFGQVVRYEYDRVGNRVKTVYPDNRAVAYAYDAKNRLARVEDWAGRATILAYDAANREIRRELPNGVVYEAAYDPAGRVTNWIYRRAGAELLRKEIARKPGGQKTTERLSGAAAAVVEEAQTRRLSYDAANRLTNSAGQAAASDKNGCLLGIENDFIAAYDLEQRLTNYRSAHVDARYVYDATGRRVLRAVSGASSVEVSDRASASRKVLMEREPAGVEIARNVWGNGLLSRHWADGRSWFYLCDEQGNVLAVTDAQGDLVARYAYTAYGKPSVAIAEEPDHAYLFVGRYGVTHEGDGLYFMGRRYYHADAQRFLTRDPLGLAGGPNLYAYADNDPVNLIDPAGLAPEEPGMPNDENFDMKAWEEAFKAEAKRLDLSIRWLKTMKQQLKDVYGITLPRGSMPSVIYDTYNKAVNEDTHEKREQRRLEGLKKDQEHRDRMKDALISEQAKALGIPNSQIQADYSDPTKNSQGKFAAFDRGPRTEQGWNKQVVMTPEQVAAAGAGKPMPQSEPKSKPEPKLPQSKSVLPKPLETVQKMVVDKVAYVQQGGKWIEEKCNDGIALTKNVSATLGGAKDRALVFVQSTPVILKNATHIFSASSMSTAVGEGVKGVRVFVETVGKAAAQSINYIGVFEVQTEDGPAALVAIEDNDGYVAQFIVPPKTDVGVRVYDNEGRATRSWRTQSRASWLLGPDNGAEIYYEFDNDNDGYIPPNNGGPPDASRAPRRSQTSGSSTGWGGSPQSVNEEAPASSWSQTSGWGSSAGAGDAFFSITLDNHFSGAGFGSGAAVNPWSAK